MAQDIAKKVTLKGLGLDTDSIRLALKDVKDKESLEIASFVGQVSGVKQKESDLGEYILFEGAFRGVNLITGLQIDSSNLIVPSVAETPLVTLFKKAIKTDEDGKILSQGIVEFAFSILVRKDSGNTGYAYGLRNHNQETGPDPMSRLLALIPAVQKLAALSPPVEEIAVVSASETVAEGKNKKK